MRRRRKGLRKTAPEGEGIKAVGFLLVAISWEVIHTVFLLSKQPIDEDSSSRVS
jgi:hypothetical protein